MLSNVRFEATGNVLHVSVTERLTYDDYAEFIPAVAELIEMHGKVRVLFEMHDFHGWTAGTLWDDIRFDITHFRDVERMAIVGERPWQRGLAAFCRPFTTARIRYFPTEEVDSALRWLHEPEKHERMKIQPQIARNLAALVGPDGVARERARDALVRMGTLIIDPLQRVAETGSRKLRWEVAKTLAELDDISAAPALAKHLDDTFGISWVAAEGLAKLGRPGAEAVLHELIHNSRSHNTRIGAHHALSHIKDRGLRRLVRPVVAALDDAAPIGQAPIAATQALDALRAYNV